MKGGDTMHSCCCSPKSHGNHVCPSLWSKKKKVQMLEQELADAKQNVQELESLIDEIKAES